MLEVVDPETGGPHKATSPAPSSPHRSRRTARPPYCCATTRRTWCAGWRGPLACELRAQPATSPLLGKLRFAVRHEAGWTFARDVLEALEGVDEVPLPARYGFWAVPGGLPWKWRREGLGRGFAAPSRRAWRSGVFPFES